jgi:hypothetical protein
MQLTLIKGYPDFVGKRANFVGWGSGPASYTQFTAATAPAVATGGDPVTLPLPNYYIDAVDSGGLTVSGTYYVRAIQSGVGARQTWRLVWYVTTGNAQVGAAVNLSAEQIQIGGKCGQY